MTVLGNSMANLKGFLPVTRGFPPDFGSRLQGHMGFVRGEPSDFGRVWGDKCGIGIVWNPMEPQQLWIEPIKTWANLPTNSSKYRIQPTKTMGSTKLAVTSITWGLKQLKETSSPLSCAFSKSMVSQMTIAPRKITNKWSNQHEGFCQSSTPNLWKTLQLLKWCPCHLKKCETRVKLLWD